jgi:hypothetical protein
MIGIRTTMGPWWRQWWPSRQSAADATAAAGRARARRLKWALGFVVGVVAGTGIAALIAAINAPTAPMSARAAAPTEPTPAVDVASMADPPQEASPSSAEPAPATVVSDGQAPAAAAPSAPMPNAMTPDANEPRLNREEVRELQARLRSFGFNPGPVDGITGRTTEGAVLRYQQERAQPQTGKVDRELLDQLRQDSTPQVHQQLAQRATRPEPRSTSSSSGARRADPLQPVKDGFDRFGRWIDSLGR